MLFNTHTHTLNKNHIPERFLPLKLMRLLSKNKVGRGVAKFLHWLIPFSSRDLFDRYAAFLTVAGEQSQFQVFQKLFKTYKDFALENNIPLCDLRFVVLSMDLEFMGAGKVKESFEKQLEELNKLSLNPAYKNIVLPFMFLDPRREDFDYKNNCGQLTRLVHKYVLDGNFRGVKVYPNLGYYPDDDRLSRIYYLLEQSSIPVLSHCSQGGIYHHSMAQKECANYAIPYNWEPVLKNYPQLKVCLAHLTGEKSLEAFFKSGEEGYEESWFWILLQMMKEYPNLYVDISYVLWDFKYFSILKLLLDNPIYRERILFGSDYYMHLMEKKDAEKVFLRLKEYLGEKDWKQITDYNPQMFFANQFYRN